MATICQYYKFKLKILKLIFFNIKNIDNSNNCGMTLVHGGHQMLVLYTLIQIYWN